MEVLANSQSTAHSAVVAPTGNLCGEPPRAQAQAQLRGKDEHLASVGRASGGLADHPVSAYRAHLRLMAHGIPRPTQLGRSSKLRVMAAAGAVEVSQGLRRRSLGPILLCRI